MERRRDPKRAEYQGIERRVRAGTANVLHYGDCLTVLRERIPPESVDLVYLDPPFNSQRAYNMIFKEHGGVAPTAQLQAFDDTWTWDERARDTLQELLTSPRTPARLRALLEGLDGAIHASEMMAYVSMMAIRIIEMHRVLKPTGSLYLHCDPTASHYLKLVLDAIFGTTNFRNEIVWLRSKNPKGSQHRLTRFSPFTDTLLFYAKSDAASPNLDRIRIPLDAARLVDKYPYSDERGPYQDGPILRSASMGPRQNLVYEYKGFTPGPAGWRVKKELLEEIDRRGNLNWTPNGVRRKLRPEDEKGDPVGSFWGDIPPVNSQAAERLGYPTQKPVALLERIISVSTNEGDVVLDPFCGCGTAIDAAERLRRRWIGIDVTHLAVGVVEQRMKVRHPGVVYDVRGLPEDEASAKKLAAEDKFGFQAWAVLKISARPMGLDAAGRAKRGADQGLDGMLTFAQDAEGKDVHNMIVSVKGGGSGAGDVRDLLGAVNTKAHKAVMGILITASEPTKPMRDAALDAGIWYSKTWAKEYPKIQILSVADLFEGQVPKHPGRNVTFAVAQTAARDEEQIVIPGLGVEGLSPEMAKRQRRPKRAPKPEATSAIELPIKKPSASKLRRVARA